MALHDRFSPFFNGEEQLEMNTVTCVVAGTCALATILLLRYFIQDPLRQVPGPRIARWTSLWIQMLDLAGYRSLVIHDLHAKFGPVVRIGPNELSFSGRQAFREIYSANSDFIKAPRYGAFGRKSMFTMRNKQEHRFRAKRIAPVFSPATLGEVEVPVSRLIEKFVHALERRVDRPLDVLLWFRILTMDTFGEMFLGTNFGGLDNEKPPEVLEELDNVFPTYYLEWQFPWLFRLLCLVPHKSLHQYITTGHRFYKNGGRAFHDYVSRYGRDSQRRDIIQRMIAASTEKKTEAPLTDDEIIVELTNLIFAGTDTTSNTFSYMFWELAKNPEWQKRLRDEFSTVVWGDEVVPRYKAVSHLPVLDAVVQETLRLWPASPASLPRIAPANGGIVDGTVIPGNTLLSSQAYTTQRDAQVYPLPNEFHPERWLPEDDVGKGLCTDVEHMRDHILVWGKGSRTCLGKSIALMELKLGVAAIIKRLSVGLGSETTNEDMEMRDHFVLTAKGGKCMLKLSRV